MADFDALKEKVENKLVSVFENLTMPAEIKDAMYYSISIGGKRIRPVLLLMFASLNGAYSETALDFAAAIEMIHTYSLIHDDLPAMDNDDLRRGKPSNHKVFGEAMAILAGDGLLSLAVQIMAQRSIHNHEAILAMNDIIEGAGAFGMVSGQAMDIMTERAQAGYSIECIDKAKTGALIKAACLAGARFSSFSEEEIGFVSDFADNLGIAFQITDDILDVIGNTELLGKNTGSDEKNEKETYVTYYGLSGAQKKAEESIDKALYSLSLLNKNTDTIKQLTLDVLKRNH